LLYLLCFPLDVVMPVQKMMPKVEQSSCTEDRIQHVLERCLSGLGLDAPDKQLWNGETPTRQR